MRDMVACFSDHAVRVSETTCSSYANHHYLLPKQPSIPQTTTPALQTSVTSNYKITLSTKKQFLVTVTWYRTHIGHQGLTISFNDDPSNAASFKISTAAARIFKKKKGARSVDLNGSKVDLLWDLSEVNYGCFSGAEPTDGFYVIIMVDAEIGLILGDLCKDIVAKKVQIGAAMAEFSSVSRTEYYEGNALYCTKAKFSETGAIHEISIRFCSGEKLPVLAVSVDKRTVVKVKRLQWNFRGNQTVFIDGLLVDLMWDVHGWFFGGGNGLAVFMFRRRNGVESRLWLEEKVVSQKKEDEEKSEFSLMICASKCS